MANDTQSCRGSKDDVSKSLRKKPASIKESSTPGSATMDTSGLRRSSREMPLEKQMSSSPSTRSRSEHLNNPTPATTSVKRKYEIVEKQRMPSPSRTSNRGKERLTLGCSGSMNSKKGAGSPDDRRKKLKSEESVEQLMPDARETSRRDKQHPHTVGFKKMDGRTYKRLLKQKRRRDTEPDFIEKLERSEVISKIDGSYCGGSVSKQVNNGEDGAENLTSQGDAAAPPSSNCEMVNIAGTHDQCSERLRGQRFENNPEVGTHEVGKKRNKVVNNGADLTSPRPRLMEGPGEDGGDSSVPVNKVSRLLPQSTDTISHTLHTGHASASASTSPSKVTSLLHEVHMVKSEEGTGLSDVQNTLYVLLNPEISKLCEILQLSEDVKVMARRFLEYVVDNHQVNREPITTLQAFQISLCWIAASLRECEIDKKASLALAKQHVNFSCSEEEVNNVHSKLRLLKKRFKGAVHDFASDRLISKQEQMPNRDKKEKELSKSIRRIKKKRDKKLRELNLKHQEKIQEFNRSWEDNSVVLERDYRLNLTIILSKHSNNAARSEKLKRREEEHAKKLKEREHEKGILIGKLEAEHLAEMNKVRQKAEICLQEIKSWAQGNSMVIQDGDAHANDNQDVLLQVEIVPLDSTGNGPTDQTNDDEALIEQVEQVQVSNSTEMPDVDAEASANHNFLQQVEDQSFNGETLPQCVEQLQSSKSTEIHVGDPEAGENQDGQTDQTNDDETLIEQVEQLQVSNSTEMPDVDAASANHNFLQQVEDQSFNGETLPQCVEQLQSSKSTEIHVGDPEAGENQDGQTDQTNDDETLIEQVEQLQVSNSTEMPDVDAASANHNFLQQVEDQSFNRETLPHCGEQLQSSKSTEIHVGDPEAGENQDGQTDQTCDDETLIEQVEQLRVSNSTEMHDVDAEASANQDVLQQVEDQTNNEEALPQCVEQLQSSKCTEFHVGDPEAGENQDGQTDQTNDETLIQQVEHLQVSNSTEMHIVDAEASANQDVLKQVEDQTNNEEALPQCVEQRQSSKSTEIHVGEAEAGENQDGQLQVEVVPCHSTDNGPTGQSNHKQELIASVQQLQMSPTSDSPVDHYQSDGSAASGVEQLPSDGLGASQPFENEPETIKNVGLPRQVEVVSVHSMDNGSSDKSNNNEAFPECVEQLQTSKSTEIHVGEAEAGENQDRPHKVEVVPCLPGSSDQTDNGEALPERVEQLRTSKSTEIHVGEAEAGENQDGPHVVEILPCLSADGGSIFQTNHREALIEGVQQLQMSPSSDSPVDHNQPVSRAASGVEQLHSEGLGASQPFESEPEASETRNDPQQVEVVQLHSTGSGSTAQTTNKEALPERMVHDGEEETRENQDGLQQVEVVPFHPVDTRPAVQTNHEEALEGVQQLQMSSFSDSPVDHNQRDVHVTSGVEQFPSEGQGASQPFENEPEALDQLGIQSGDILELPPLIHATDVPLGPHLQLAVENGHQPSSQGFMPLQDAGASSRPVEDTALVPNQAVSLTHLGMHPPLEGFGTHLPLNNAPQTQPFYGDPLLNELARVHKERDKTFKIHEDTKVSLKFEFGKELREAIAGIRRKYDDKFHNAESAFLLKKKELESNMKKVLMNKILADAFQSKCHALLRSPQGVPSNIMQQHIPSSRPVHEPSRVTVSTSVPFVPHSSPPFSTTPAGPALILPITPPIVNLRASSEIRAPAPHLQRFRPNIPIASPSVTHVRTTSPSVPHVRSHYDWGRQAEVAVRTSEILFDNNNQPGAPPNLLPPLQDLGVNFGSLNLSQFGSCPNAGGDVVVNVASSATASDVVCLSDDDD